MVYDMIKKLLLMFRRRIVRDKNEEYYLTMSNRLHPYSESAVSAFAYCIMGFIWLSIPDDFIGRVLHSETSFRQINIMRGWTFVVVSTMLIFGFLLRRLLLFKGALKNLAINLKKLKKSEEELNQMAFYDMLTKLPNRNLLEQRFIQIKQNKEARFALVCMDVDNFKFINDTHGHPVGDQFLIYLSSLLMKYITSDDFVARIGGDEFIIILSDIKNQEEAETRIKYLLWSLRKTWYYEGQKFNISVSMGAALYPEHGDDLYLLLRNSDIAMYSVKKKRKNNYEIYSNKLDKKNTKNIMMISELQKAIDNEEFILLYQPIINLTNGRLSGVEALIRWNHPEQGMISPIDFIPLAEESGLIHEMEAWILKTAFYQKKMWDEKMPGCNRLIMSINISGKSFVHYGFVNTIRNLLMQTGVNSNEIQLEITETVFMEKMDISKKVINDISNMGVQIALDDFGSGYSSLTYLKNLPIDVVKLDANFIKGIMNHGEDRVIVESVIELTHNLGLRIVAEGIETNSQLIVLKDNGCDLGQGYLFRKPVTELGIEEMIIKEASPKRIARIKEGII